MKKWYERLTDEQRQQLKNNQVPPGLMQSGILLAALEAMPNTDRQWWDGKKWMPDNSFKLNRHSGLAHRLRPDWERPLEDSVFTENSPGNTVVSNAYNAVICTSYGNYIERALQCLENAGVRTDWAEWDEHGRFVRLTDKCDFEVPDVLRPKLRRVRIGQPKTVWELWKMISKFTDDLPLAGKNRPLPTLYHLEQDGQECIEIEVDG